MKISQKNIEKLVLTAYNKQSLVFLGAHNRNELDGVGAFAWTDIPNGSVLFEGVNIGNVIDDNIEINEDIIGNHIHNPGALHFLKNRIVPITNDEGKLVYDVPRGGPNCMTASFYVNHAHDKDDSKQRANIMVSNEVQDCQGYDAFVAKTKILAGTELVLEYDPHVEEMMRISKYFLEKLEKDEEGLARAKTRGTSTLETPIREVVDNLNKLCIILRPSNIHGVGIFVGPGGADVIKDGLQKDSSGIDPFELAEGATPQGTLDLTINRVMRGVPNQRSLLFIEQHLIEFSSMDGDEEEEELLIPLPIGGPSSIDLSFLVNSTENTKKKPNLVMKEVSRDGAGADTVRGMSSMVITNSLEEGTELLSNYALVDDKENDGGIESSKESSKYKQDSESTSDSESDTLDYKQYSESTSDSESDTSVARGKSVKKKAKVTTGKGTKKKKKTNDNDGDEVDEKTQRQNWAKAGRKSSYYENALLGTGKFQSARPHPKADADKVKLTMPTQSSVIPTSDLPERWRKLALSKWELMWENRGKPPLSAFSGKNDDEKRMKRAIYCAEKSIACNCPSVEEDQFTIQNVAKGMVKCNNCNSCISVRHNGQGTGTHADKLENHAKGCKTFMCDFPFLFAETNNTCDCGYSLTDLQQMFGCKLTSITNHLNCCAAYPALLDQLREYRETYKDHKDVKGSTNKELYDWVRNMKKREYEKYTKEIEKLGF